MASINWSSGVVMGWNEEGLIAVLRPVPTDSAGIELRQQLLAEHPTWKVVYIVGQWL